MHMKDGVDKLLKTFYYHQPHQRVSWEKREELYDILYGFDPDIHITYMLKRLETTTRDVVIDDVRYINELNALVDQGFLVVRVSMPEEKRRALMGYQRMKKNTILLNELFGKKDVEKYPVRYSIVNSSKQGTWSIIDRILEENGRVLDK